MPKLIVTQTVRISQEMEKEIEDACEETELSKQELIRLCIKVGLEYLQKIDFNLAKTIVEAKRGK